MTAEPTPKIGAQPHRPGALDKHRRLREAALRHFARDGVAGARIENVVKEAGTSWGTFFHYFPRKEDVLLDAAIEIYLAARAAAEATLAEPGRTVGDALCVLFEGFAASAYPPGIVWAMLREVLSEPLRFSAMLGEGETPMIVLVARFLGEGQERGEVRRDAEPLMLATVLAPAVLITLAEFAFGRLQGFVPGDPVAIARQSFELAWSGVGPIETPRA